MVEGKRQGPAPELDDEEKGHLRELFFQEVVPKLSRLHARNGIVSCEFGGPEYRKWQIRFSSRGSDFEIEEFEYDEEGESMDLDL